MITKAELKQQLADIYGVDVDDLTGCNVHDTLAEAALMGGVSIFWRTIPDLDENETF